MDFVLLYSEKLSPRLHYIVRLVFGDILGLQCEVTDQAELFRRYHGPRINYSGNKSLEGIHVQPAGLLFENGLRETEPEMEKYPLFPILFPSREIDGLPFDLFSASFYLVSRYEEYLPFAEDRHGRFEASLSFAFRKGFLERPLVNEWADYLARVMLKSWPELPVRKKEFRFVPTIDVDSAWAYRNKGLLRSSAASLLDLMKGNTANLGRRIRILSGTDQDPFDNFDWINSVHASYERIPVWFFLSGKYGRYDPNVPVRHPEMKKLIHSCTATGLVGVHPSYGAAIRNTRLNEEVQNLASVTGTPILKSRQHFLKIRFPETFRLLIESGIQDDYSLGYASMPGFRASICTPFPFYDLLHEKSTTLILHPFQVMDRTFSSYLRLEPAEALTQIMQMEKITRKFNGEFISIFHNESFTDDAEGRGWRLVYLEMNQLIK